MCFMKLFLFCKLIIFIVLTSCRGYVNDEVSFSGDDYECEILLRSEIRKRPERIYLFKTVDDQQKKLNRKLIHLAIKLGFDIKSVNKSSFPSCNLYDDITTMRLAAKYGAVINLRTKLVLPKEYGYFSKTFEDISLIGQISYGEIETVETRVCNGTDKYKTIDDEVYETCEMVSTSIHTQTAYIKVISNSVDKLLAKIIEGIDVKDEQYDTYWNNYVEVYRRVTSGSRVSIQREYILVCGIHDDILQKSNFSDLILYTSDCKNMNDFSKIDIELLVVIAKKPLENEYFTDLPIFFYNTPSISDYHATYPNSMVLFDKNLELLVNGLMRLAKLVHWNRIAILSDDAPHSKEFERTVVGALTNSNVLYAVKSCLAAKCEIEEGLDYFKKNKARIIIANIEETRIPQVMESAKKLDLTAAAGIIWIFRELTVDSRSNLEKLEKTYILKLEPVSQTPKKISLDSIGAAIAVVNENLKKFPKKVDKLKRNSVEEVGKNHSRQWRRKLANMYKKERQRVYSAEFQLQKISNSGRRPVVIYAYNFKDGKAGMQHLSYLNDGPTACFFLSHRFENPCNDSLILVISLVLLAFLLTLLILFEFFRNFTQNGFHYRHIL